jgi:hypothetical protein
MCSGRKRYRVMLQYVYEIGTVSKEPNAGGA